MFPLQAVLFFVFARRQQHVFQTRSVTSLSRRGFSVFHVSLRANISGHRAFSYDSCSIPHIYTSTSIFITVSRRFDINFVFPFLVKQRDQDEGVHEMTAMSWKLGGGSTERSFTKPFIIAEALLSL